MIIYRKSDETVVIPCGLGPVVCPDSSHDLQMKQVDSSTVLQQVVPDSGYYGLYRVIVNPLTDPNLLPGNIKEGVEILGVMGTYAGMMLNLQAKTANPLLVEQVITFDYPHNGLSSVTIAPVTSDIDPDIQAGNIKRGVEILGVTGTFDGGSLQSKTVNSSTASQTVKPDNGNYGLSSVTVNPYTLESKAQTIKLNGTYSFTPTSADGLSSVDISVNVAGIPAVVQSKSVTYNENGEYTVTPDQGYDGLSSVDISVNVPDIPAVLQEKTVNSSTSSQSVTYDSGYDGLSSVTIEPYTLDSKTVNSSTSQQVITSDKDGLSSVTVEPYVLDSKTVNPSTSQQTVTSSADGLSSVTVNAVTSSIDPDIQAGNIKRGVEILGVTGTFDGGSLQSKEVNSSTNSQSVTPDSGYYGLSGVTVKPYTLESKAQTITLNGTYSFIPTSADGLSSVDISVNVADIPAVVQSKTVTYTENGEYTVTPDQGYDGLSSVDISVNIPSEPVVLQSKTVKSSIESQSVTYDSGYDGLSSVTVEPYVLDSKTVNSSTAQQVITSDKDGLSSVTVEPYTLDSKTVDPSTSQITVNSSADGLSSVTVNAVTSSIDANISSSNIKRGVEILGVTGTFDGGSLGTKTVNSSTSTQTITPEPSDYGLSSVTVEPYVLDSKTVNSSTAQQVITSDVNGLSSVTVEPYVLDSKTVNSSTAQQVITSDVNGLSSVTVNPYTVESDSSTLTQNGTYTFTPQNADALSSVTIDVSVEGQVINNQSKTINSSTSTQIVNFDSGYTGLSSVTVNPYTLDSKTVDPSTSQQVITSDEDGLSSVTVNAVTSSIDPDIQAGNIKRGIEILGVTGTFDGGSLGTKTVNSSTSTQTITPEPSDYGLSSVTVNAVTSSIDSNIQAGNIKSGVTILGITGNYSGTTINNQNKTVDPSTDQQSITADSGYTGLGIVTVNAAPLEIRTVDASVNQIQVSRSTTDYYGLRTVTINAVTSSIDSNIVAENIKDGVTIMGVTGTYGIPEYDAIYAALIKI